MKLRRGFTLIELALVLVIVSLMTGFGMQAVESTSGVNCYETTEAQLATIDTALKTFAATNQRLPKPAYMDLGSGEPGFGKEALDGVPDSLPGQKNTVAFGSAVPTGMSSNNGVLFGALPHAELGLSAQYAADCWGDKFSYSVVNSQTSSDTNQGYVSGNQGTIELYSGDPGSSALLANNAVYVVFSHGQDKYGATPLTTDRTTAKNCNGSSAAKIDKANCDYSDTKFANAIRSTGNTNKYFDDMLVYSQKTRSNESCPSQAVSWITGSGDHCNSSSPDLANGGTARLTNASTYYSGTIDIRCRDGTLEKVGTGTCDLRPSCAAGSAAQWTVDGYTCRANTTAEITHKSGWNGISNSRANYIGSVEVNCQDGNLIYRNPVCGPTPCAAQSVSWGPGSCTGTLPQTPVPDSVTTTNVTQYWGGNATYACRNDKNDNPSYWQLTSSSCIPRAPCDGKTVTWGACSVTIPALGHEQTNNFSNTRSGYTGSANIQCINGATSVQSSSCYQDCAAARLNWGPGNACFADFPAMVGSGATSTQTNAAGGYTGSATFQCNNGSPAYQGGNCDLVVNATCGGAHGGSTLSAPSSDLCAQGTASGVSGSGPWTWSCSGSGGGGNANCSSHRSCGGTTQSWGSNNCSASIGAQANSWSGPVSNTASGYSGSATMSCNEGSWGVSGASCTINRAPLCWEQDSTECDKYYGPGCSNSRWCGMYRYTDGSTETDFAPCDGPGFNQPPPGWTMCGGGPSCIVDGQSSGGSAANCCNGDADNNGTCGNQTPPCTADGFAPGGGGCCNGDSDGNGICGYQNPGCGGDQSYCQGGLCYIQCNGICDTCSNPNGNVTTVVTFGTGCDGSVCPAPCAANGQPPAGVGCCNGDSDGNGICGYQPPTCTADGNPPGGGGCCNGDSDGNGICGYQPPACKADGTPPAGGTCCNADTDGNGLCGYQPPACTPDGSPPGGGGCCNGDSDGNGVCGTQGGGSCPPAAEAAFEAACNTYSSGGTTDSSSQNWSDCQACGGGYIATCYYEGSHSEYGTWEEYTYSWQSMKWDGSGSAYNNGVSCSEYRTSGSYPGGNRNEVNGTCPYPGPSCNVGQNGVCGSANGQNFNSAPSGGSLCNPGTASSVTGSGPWNWTCAGSGGGTTANCQAYKICNGTTYTWGGGCTASVPTSNFNSANNYSNTAPGRSGSAYIYCDAGGSWNHLTSTATCNTTATPQDAECGYSSCGASCAVGTYGGDTGQVDCNGGQMSSSFWCRGVNGGADAECRPICCGNCSQCT